MLMVNATTSVTKKTRASAAANVIERMIAAPDGTEHRLLINIGESPTTWLFSRNLLTRRQYDAAEAIRRDWEYAGMGARVTMNWDVVAAQSRGSGGGRGAPDLSIGQISARDRLNGALAAAGPGLIDILWRVVCACEGLGAAERALGWPVRAGKLVLGFALDRVADYYRIR